MSAKQDIPQDASQPARKPVLRIDDDPHNADWLRILERARQQQSGEQSDEPTLPPSPPDDAA